MKKGVRFLLFTVICIGVCIVWYYTKAVEHHRNDALHPASFNTPVSEPSQSKVKRTLPHSRDANTTSSRAKIRDYLEGIDLVALAQQHTKPYDWLNGMIKASKQTKYRILQRYRNVSLQERMKRLGVAYGDPVFIRIFKNESLLEVWIEKEGIFRHLKDYTICAWSGGLGPKLKEGDKQAPEGFYRVYRRQLNPKSRYHLAFNLGYPNAYDRAHGRTGSFLMVHGGCCSVGCYAMTDRRIEEIYRLVEKALEQGQPYVSVHIFPFRLTDTALARYSDSRWFDFWMNLKEGFDYFEHTHQVPTIKVTHKRYVVYE